MKSEKRRIIDYDYSQLTEILLQREALRLSSVCVGGGVSRLISFVSFGLAFEHRQETGSSGETKLFHSDTKKPDD